MALEMKCLEVDLPGYPPLHREVPVIAEALPPELREAVARQHLTLLEGRCPCGAERVIETEDGRYMFSCRHTASCPADQNNFRRLLERAGETVPDDQAAARRHLVAQIGRLTDENMRYKSVLQKVVPLLQHIASTGSTDERTSL